jgi:hypothetical protein
VQAVLFVLLVYVVDRAVSFSSQQAPYLRSERDPGAVPVASIPPCVTDIFLKVRGDGRACLPDLTSFLDQPAGQPAPSP